MSAHNWKNDKFLCVEEGYTSLWSSRIENAFTTRLIDNRVPLQLVKLKLVIFLS